METRKSHFPYGQRTQREKWTRSILLCQGGTMKQMLFVKTKMRPWNALWQKVMNLFAARDYDVRLTSWTDDFTGLGSRFASLLPKEASAFSQTQPAEFHDVVG